MYILFFTESAFSLDVSIFPKMSSLSPVLGGVYIRKLSTARVSYRDEFLISYRVYIMTGSFHISLFEGTLHVGKIHV